MLLIVYEFLDSFFFFLPCRLFADIMNDAAMCIELFSVFFPQYFVIIACVSSLFKVRILPSQGVLKQLYVVYSLFCPPISFAFY